MLDKLGWNFLNAFVSSCNNYIIRLENSDKLLNAFVIYCYNYWMRLENSATITKYVCQSLLQFLKALFTLWYNYWRRFFILIQFLNEVISQSVTIIKWFFTVRYNYWMRFSFSVTIIECFCCTLLQLRTLFATIIEAIILAVLSILNWYFIVRMYLVLLPTACYIWQ